jgi:hypothetical protein
VESVGGDFRSNPANGDSGELACPSPEVDSKQTRREIDPSRGAASSCQYRFSPFSNGSSRRRGAKLLRPRDVPDLSRLSRCCRKPLLAFLPTFTRAATPASSTARSSLSFSSATKTRFACKYEYLSRACRCSPESSWVSLPVAVWKSRKT